MSNIKLEVKPDPDAMDFKPSPGAFDDQDLYVDTEDLEFNLNPAYNNMFLGKVPPYLWEAWDKLDDDAEIEIGTIRQSTQKMPDGSTKNKFAMLLHNNLAAHQMVPKEYMLDVTNERADNMFVFTEQDLPGFKSRSTQKFDLASANMPARLAKAKNDKLPKEKFDPNKRFQPYFRKAVPKRTTLQGKIAQELNVIAVDNAESERFLRQRADEQMKPKVGTIFIRDDKGITGKGFIMPGMSGANSYKNFIKTKNTGTTSRPQQQKFARMPKNELMDLLFKCFKDYKYWSMKSLRAKLQQPESYLKETLEPMAVLAKSGRFASMWSLNNDYSAQYGEASNIENAPAEDGGAEDSDMADAEDGDDEDIKFEDVA